MNPTVAGSVWLLRVARGDTQRQIRPGPTSAPTISALFAASNVFDRTLMPTVVGLGRGRTSTCSMISFAIRPVDTSLTQHVSTVTELDLQRRMFGFSHKVSLYRMKTPSREKVSKIRKAFDDAFLGKPATDFRGPNAYVFLTELSF